MSVSERVKNRPNPRPIDTIYIEFATLMVNAKCKSSWCDVAGENRAVSVSFCSVGVLWIDVDVYTLLRPFAFIRFILTTLKSNAPVQSPNYGNNLPVSINTLASYFPGAMSVASSYQRTAHSFAYSIHSIIFLFFFFFFLLSQLALLFWSRFCNICKAQLSSILL